MCVRELYLLFPTVRPCSRSPCANGNCTDIKTPPSYRCTCPSGYQGRHCIQQSKSSCPFLNIRAIFSTMVIIIVVSFIIINITRTSWTLSVPTVLIWCGFYTSEPFIQSPSTAILKPIIFSVHFCSQRVSIIMWSICVTVDSRLS